MFLDLFERVVLHTLNQLLPPWLADEEVKQDAVS
jgi:hypothetical protein